MRRWTLVAPVIVIVVEVGLVASGVVAPPGPAAKWLAAHGHSRSWVVSRFGSPDQVVTEREAFSRAPLSAYRASERPLADSVLVYLRNREMVCIYLDEAGLVVAVYFGAPAGQPPSFVRHAVGDMEE